MTFLFSLTLRYQLLKLKFMIFRTLLENLRQNLFDIFMKCSQFDFVYYFLCLYRFFDNFLLYCWSYWLFLFDFFLRLSNFHIYFNHCFYLFGTYIIFNFFLFGHLLNRCPHISSIFYIFLTVYFLHTSFFSPEHFLPTRSHSCLCDLSCHFVSIPRRNISGQLIFYSFLISVDSGNGRLLFYDYFRQFILNFWSTLNLLNLDYFLLCLNLNHNGINFLLNRHHRYLFFDTFLRKFFRRNIRSALLSTIYHFFKRKYLAQTSTLHLLRHIEQPLQFLYHRVNRSHICFDNEKILNVISKIIKVHVLQKMNILLTLKKEFEIIIIGLQMDCIICLGELQNPETLPCCLKTFCGDCLTNWVNVRNCCPLCITPIGKEHKNQLANACTEEFDNGCLMLESQMANVMQRYSHLQALLYAKREASSNHKNLFPRSRLQYAEREMQKMQQNMEIASLALSENDRVTATSSIQEMTECIYSIEDVLSGRAEFEHYEYSSDSQGEEEDYYRENRLYEMAEQQQRRANLKNNNKRKV